MPFKVLGGVYEAILEAKGYNLVRNRFGAYVDYRGSRVSSRLIGKKVLRIVDY
jgi:hypothetical protein